MPFLTNAEDSACIYYHHRATVCEFIRIFEDIKVEIDESGALVTPQSQAFHTMTLKFQKQIERGRSVIHINHLKIALYNFLMRETKYRSGKLKEIQNRECDEALLLLVIACSIGLPTRRFTKAYEFFEFFTRVSSRFYLVCATPRPPPTTCHRGAPGNQIHVVICQKNVPLPR